jgi:hypothetical protein
MGKPPEHKETNAQNDKPGWIMPLGDGFCAAFSGNATEKESASHIAQECDQHSGKHKKDPPLPVGTIKFAKKKRDHECRLKGPDATACFIDAQQSGFDFDEVSVL